MFAETNKIEIMKKLLVILAIILMSISANAQRARGSWFVGAKESTVGMWTTSELIPALRIEKHEISISGCKYEVLYSKKCFLRREHNLIMVDNVNPELTASLSIRKIGNNEYYVLLRDNQKGFQAQYLYKL